MNPDERKALWRWVFAAMAAAAVVLGFGGFLAQDGWRVGWAELHGAAISTLQLFVMNVGSERLTTPATQLASLMAPLSAAGVVVLAFIERIIRRARFALLALRPPAELFIGCGDTAAAIRVAERLHSVQLQRELRDGQSGVAVTSGNRVQTPRREMGRVVGLDCLAETPLERDEPNAWLFVGDALSVEYLRAVNAARALKVWVLTGEDLRNLEIAARLIAERQRSAAATPGVVQTMVSTLRRIAGGRLRTGGCDLPTDGREQVVFVSVHDSTLARAKESLQAMTLARTRIEYFDLPRLVARRLVQLHPPPFPSPFGAPATQRPRLHLCIVGGSSFAPALLVHAARHCVYSEDPAACVQLSWICTDASQRLQELYLRYPALDPANARRTSSPGDPAIGELLPMARIVALDAHPSFVTPAQWLSAQEETPFAMVYVTADNDLLTMDATRRALAVEDVCASLEPTPRTMQARRGKIVACLTDVRSRAGSNRSLLPDSVAQFNVFEVCFSAGEPYPGERADRLARIIHLAYSARDARFPTNEERQAATKRWKAETDDFRWSSRYSADHIAVKLAVLGRSVESVRLEGSSCRGSDTRLVLRDLLEQPDVLELLMRLEHRRFIVERLLDGWLPVRRTGRPEGDAPSGLPYAAEAAPFTQKRYLRLNATIVPYDALTNEDRGLDRQMIRAIPACLSAALEEPVRMDRGA